MKYVKVARVDLNQTIAWMHTSRSIGTYEFGDERSLDVILNFLTNRIEVFAYAKAGEFIEDTANPSSDTIYTTTRVYMKKYCFYKCTATSAPEKCSVGCCGREVLYSMVKVNGQWVRKDKIGAVTLIGGTLGKCTNGIAIPCAAPEEICDLDLKCDVDW